MQKYSNISVKMDLFQVINRFKCNCSDFNDEIETAISMRKSICLRCYTVSKWTGPRQVKISILIIWFVYEYWKSHMPVYFI